MSLLTNQTNINSASSFYSPASGSLTSGLGATLSTMVGLPVGVDNYNMTIANNILTWNSQAGPSPSPLFNMTCVDNGAFAGSLNINTSQVANALSIAGDGSLTVGVDTIITTQTTLAGFTNFTINSGQIGLAIIPQGGMYVVIPNSNVSANSIIIVQCANDTNPAIASAVAVLTTVIPGVSFRVDIGGAAPAGGMGINYFIVNRT